MIAPAGSQRDVHPDGERATAAAAGAMGTLYALPTGSGYSIEEVAEVATGPLWFQLYHFDDEVTELLVTRAKAAGFKAVCLTIDTPTPSPKERDLRNAHARTPGLYWGSLRDRMDLVERREVGIPDMADWTPPGYTGLTWDRLDWLKDLTGLPLVVKGIRTIEDAVMCAEYGADGIVVSNHGGRQLDGTRASIETLPEIADAVGDNLEIYLDSGVRRGLDVLKAIALGARVYSSEGLCSGVWPTGDSLASSRCSKSCEPSSTGACLRRLPQRQRDSPWPGLPQFRIQDQTLGEFRMANY